MGEGYAVASINYRFSQHAVYPAQLHDCQRAVRFLREHAKEYNLDAERFGVWGASAGGHLVALLGTTAGVKELDAEPDSKFSDKVQAVCDWFGPTDLEALVPPTDPDERRGETRRRAAGREEATRRDRGPGELPRRRRRAATHHSRHSRSAGAAVAERAVVRGRAQGESAGGLDRPRRRRARRRGVSQGDARRQGPR